MAEKKQPLKRTFVNFARQEPGYTLRGKLLAVDMVSLRDDTVVPKYTLETSEETVAFLGTSQLVEALEDVPIGTPLEIVFNGVTNSGKFGRLYDFDIYRIVDGGE